MNKGLKVSLVYFLIVLFTMIASRSVFLFVKPTSHETLILMNIFAYLLGLIGLIYLTVLLIKKIPTYPMLIGYVIILIANSFAQLLMILSGYYLFFLYQFVWLFQVGMFFFTLIFAILMLVNKGWPKIVSFVLFANLPRYLLNIGGTALARLTYDWFDTFDVFSYVGLILGLLLLLLTTKMLYVLYYDKEQIKSFAYEEGY